MHEIIKGCSRPFFNTLKQYNMMILIFMVLAHFIADFTHLSTRGMLKAKMYGTPLFPILHHALVHGVLIGLLTLNPIVAIIITITHFFIDVLKGKLNVLFPQLMSASNIYHWYIFGADQFLHILVIIACYHYFC